MKITKMLLTKNKYSRPGTKLNQVSKIVIHWVGNANSTAVNNRNYFNNLNGTYASSHYIIGLDGEILLCVPENEVAYHAKQANSYSIGIECCHPDWGGKFNKKTYSSLISLCVDLCKRYNLNPITDIIRHYDVTGKDCPSYYVSHICDWNKLKEDVLKEMDGGEEVIEQITITLNGKEKKVDVINKNGNNFIKLQDLRDDKISVGYANKKPIITVKS